MAPPDLWRCLSGGVLHAVVSSDCSFAGASETSGLLGAFTDGFGQKFDEGVQEERQNWESFNLSGAASTLLVVTVISLFPTSHVQLGPPSKRKRARGERRGGVEQFEKVYLAIVSIQVSIRSWRMASTDMPSSDWVWPLTAYRFLVM